MARLILVFNKQVIRDFPFVKESMAIGRSEGNDIVMDNLAVSGFHARIDRTAESYILTDLHLSTTRKSFPAGYNTETK